MRQQLAHSGIDERVAGFSLGPRRESFGINAPGKAGELRAQRLLRGVREVVQQVMGKLAPGDLAQIGFGGFVGAQLTPDLGRADFSEVQVGGTDREVLRVIGPAPRSAEGRRWG